MIEAVVQRHARWGIQSCPPMNGTGPQCICRLTSHLPSSQLCRIQTVRIPSISWFIAQFLGPF